MNRAKLSVIEETRSFLLNSLVSTEEALVDNDERYYHLLITLEIVENVHSATNRG